MSNLRCSINQAPAGREFERGARRRVDDTPRRGNDFVIPWPKTDIEKLVHGAVHNITPRAVLI